MKFIVQKHRTKTIKKLQDQNEIRIRVSIRKAIALAAVAIGVFAICCWAIFKIILLPPGFKGAFLLLGISSILFVSGLCCIVSIINLIDRRKGLILNNHGIQINIGPNRGQFVPWKQITALKIHHEFPGPGFILLFVKNPNHFISNSNFWRNFNIKMNNFSHKTPLSLSSTWLECSFLDLVYIIQQKLNDNGA